MYLQHPKYKIDYSKFQIQHPKYKIDYSKFQIQFPKYQMDYLEYHIQNSQERARLLGLSQRALNEGNTNAIVFVTGDQVFDHNSHCDDTILPGQQRADADDVADI